MTDAGSGTGTLFAQVEITARADSTEFEANLRAGNNPVIGANVVLKDRDTEQLITLEQQSAGAYRATARGYARTLELKIVAGEDALEAVLQGPAPHQITRPENGARVRRGEFESLLVQWRADDDADATRIDLEGGNFVEGEGDTYEGRVSLQGVMTGRYGLSVRRETSTELAGGIDGSIFRARYRVDNELVFE